MSSATVTAIINRIVITGLTTNQAQLDFQDKVALEVARQMLPGVILQTGAAYHAATRGTTEYTLPTGNGARTPLAIFYDDTQLALTSIEEAQMFQADWRGSPGRPLAILLDTVNRDRYQLVPPPQQDSGTVTGSPYAVPAGGWPTEVITEVYTKSDTTYAPASIKDTLLAVAFEVIFREFGRDSDHHDAKLSAAAKGMANIFWQLSFPVETGE